MLTPEEPASAKSRASSPGWSGTETKTERVARAGPPCLPGIACGAGDAASEQLAQHGAVAVGHGPLQDVELLADLGEQAVERARVERDDLLPQRRIAARDPGDVADALTRQREVGGGCSGQPPGDQNGQQVGQVRRTGDCLVVLERGHPHRHRPADRCQLLDQRHRVARRAGVGVTAHGRPSNSAALAARGPDRSLPAIGWPPT